MVSDFIYVTSNPELSPGIQFKIWARSSFSDQTAYAAEIGPKILDDYVKKYFDIPFPLPKVDMAAIPDFAAGMFLFFFFIYSLFLNVRLSKWLECSFLLLFTTRIILTLLGAMENWGLVTYR